MVVKAEIGSAERARGPSPHNRLIRRRWPCKYLQDYYLRHRL